MSDETKPAAQPQLDASRFTLAEQVCTIYTITVEEKLTKEQILHPDFWGAVAAKLRPYDEIKVRCDDGTFYARLLVMAAERTFARVRTLEWYDLTTRDVAKSQAKKDEPTPEELKAYRVEYKGPHLKCCVIRNADGAIVREKEPSKKAAEAWLDDYVRITTA